MADEEHKEESRSPGKRWSFGIGSMLPVVALCLSLVSLYTSERARRDVERVDVIKTDYGFYHDLAQLQLQYPLTEHLFTVTGETYDSNVARIKTASSSANDQDRAKLLLQERAVAHSIFTTYEETFLLWQQSRGTDQRRAELVHGDLEYFNEWLRSNPRLLWYWDGEGGNLYREFARVWDYYNQNVSKDSPTPKDPAGPFGH